MQPGSVDGCILPNVLDDGSLHGGRDFEGFAAIAIVVVAQKRQKEASSFGARIAASQRGGELAREIDAPDVSGDERPQSQRSRQHRIREKRKSEALFDAGYDRVVAFQLQRYRQPAEVPVEALFDKTPGSRVARLHDERPIREGGEIERILGIRERVAGRNGQAKPVDVEGNNLNARLVQIAFDEDHVAPPVAQMHQRLAQIATLHHDRRLGMPSTEERDGTGKHAVADRLGARQPHDEPTFACDRPQTRLERRNACQNLDGGRVKLAAKVGGNAAPVASFRQRAADALRERCHLGRNSGLREVQRLRRSRHAAQLDNAHERTQKTTAERGNEFVLTSALHYAIFVAALFFLFIGRAAASTPPVNQLVMFRQAGCPFCARWDREIGVTYAKTDEAKILPLREVDLHAPRPSDLRSIAGVIYTPTFVVMHCGAEIARITGYISPDQFWGLLDEAVSDIKASSSCKN
jgi:hypothetical protein